MENVKDTVVIIAGASSGMGAVTARKLVQHGAKVVLAARREDKLQQLVTELGTAAIFVKTDVSRRADVDNLIRQAIKEFGKVDVLWNNAGIMPISFFEEGKVEEWDRMIDINIKGVLYGINAVLPYMLERGQGHILATSSIGGKITFKSGGVFSGTKIAVKAIMETLRDETAGKVKTTTIYPGAVTTDLGQDITSPRVFELLGALQNLARLNTDATPKPVTSPNRRP